MKSRITFTPMLTKYMLKLTGRVLIFTGVLVLYILRKSLITTFMTTPITRGITPMHALWCVFMTTMIVHIFPYKELSMALRKGKAENFIEVPGYDRLELLEYVHDMNRRALTVMLVWLSFNAIWGILFVSGIIDTSDLLMLTVFYYLSDYICILFFCPFQTIFMKNKCCITCRIYDWGHFMMFTPMLFIKNFFSWSLFFTSCVVLLHWELVYAKHPERFWEGSNQTLRCGTCADKTCQIKKRLAGKR